MRASDQTFILAELDESVAALAAARESAEFISQMHRIADAMTGSLRQGGKVLLAGNGGSAADAQHIAGELVSRLNYDRSPYAGMALTTDSSVLTAIGNDYGYEHIFSRQVAGVGMAGDVFVGISTSGRSANILAALDTARARKLVTVGFTGAIEGPMRQRCDFLLEAPSKRTPIIQQLHITAAHIICGLIERALDPKDSKSN